MKRIAIATLALGLLLAPAPFAVAQKPTKSTTTKKESTSTAKAEKATEKKEAGGRLPRHFASIVDDTQRQKIYSIQETYREKMEALRQELAALEAKQMTEVEAVLTAAQKKELESLREATESGKKPAEEKATTTTKKKAG